MRSIASWEDVLGICREYSQGSESPGKFELSRERRITVDFERYFCLDCHIHFPSLQYYCRYLHFDLQRQAYKADSSTTSNLS